MICDTNDASTFAYGGNENSSFFHNYSGLPTTPNIIKELRDFSNSSILLMT